MVPVSMYIWISRAVCGRLNPVILLGLGTDRATLLLALSSILLRRQQLLRKRVPFGAACPANSMVSPSFKNWLI
jgi:hypothetical protein